MKFPLNWPLSHFEKYSAWAQIYDDRNDPILLDIELATENKLAIQNGTQVDMQLCLTALLFCSTLNTNPESYTVMLTYLTDPVDRNFEHPVLHEIAEQVGNDKNRQECFKLLWEHPVYKPLWDNDKYFDKYGLTAKQRLAISYIDDLEFIEYMRNTIGVRRVKQRHTPHGRIRIPQRYEYDVTIYNENMRFKI